MPKKKSPFAEAKDGSLYVAADAIMSPMCALIDGLSITTFGRGKRWYIPIDTAIDWCRKEMKYHSRERYEEAIAAMESVKQQAAAERTP